MDGHDKPTTKEENYISKTTTDENEKHAIVVIKSLLKYISQQEIEDDLIKNNIMTSKITRIITTNKELSKWLC